MVDSAGKAVKEKARRGDVGSWTSLATAAASVTSHETPSSLEFFVGYRVCYTRVACTYAMHT